MFAASSKSFVKPTYLVTNAVVQFQSVVYRIGGSKRRVTRRFNL